MDVRVGLWSKLSTEKLMLLKVVLEKTLESPLDCKEIQPVHPKGNQACVFIGRTDAEAETPILWPPDVKSWFIGKDPDAWRDWGQEEKGTTEDEMAGWHHRLDGHEFEQTQGVGDGQGGLACCDLWCRKELDMTKWLNWTELNHFHHHHTRFLSFRCRHSIICLENISLTFGQEFLSMSCFCLENKFINAGKVSSGDFRGQGSCYGWGERRNVLFFTKKPGEERETSFRRRAYISQQNRRTSTSEKKPAEKLLVLSGKMDQRTRQYNNRCWDFPCGPVVETSLSNAGVLCLILGQRAKTPHSSWPKNQNIKYKHYSNTFKI